MYSRAYVEITNICNMSCSFCHGTKRPPREMTAEEFERALDQLERITEYIYLHLLGEPLCHSQVIPFIKTATARGFKVTVTTNGTLLTKELVHSGVYKVQISLHSFEDGSDDDRRDYLQGIIDFSRLENVIIVDSSQLQNIE